MVSAEKRTLLVGEGEFRDRLEKVETKGKKPGGVTREARIEGARSSS